MRVILLWTCALCTVLAVDIPAEDGNVQENIDLTEQFGNVIIETVKTDLKAEDSEVVPLSSPIKDLEVDEPNLPLDAVSKQDTANSDEQPSSQTEQSEVNFLGDFAYGKLQQIYQGLRKSLMGENSVEEEVSERKNVEPTENVAESVVDHNITDDNIQVGNTTVNESIPATVSKPKVTCVASNETDEPAEVKIVNSTLLLQAIVPEANQTALTCVLVMFYAPWCQFCAGAAPHYNALARAFPVVNMLAVNAMTHGSLNTRYGIVAIPSVVLFHGNRAVAKFNDSQYILDKFAGFITKYTGLLPSATLNVTSLDFEGPLPSVATKETDYMLLLAWLFIIACGSVGFFKSPLCQHIMEIVRSNWREAEAQHEHNE